MQAVIDRLKASKLEETRRQRAEGFSAGTKWAKEQASVRQFRILDLWYRNLDDSARDKIFNLSVIDRVYSPSGFLAAAFLVGRESSDEPSKTVEDAWERVFGEDAAEVFYYDTLGDPDWLRGFAEGALSIWDTVKAAV